MSDQKTYIGQSPEKKNNDNQTKPPETKRPVAPEILVPKPQAKIIWRGTESFRHDVVRLHVATMKKNVSYKKYQPQYEFLPHVHNFHTTDMKGKPNLYSASVGGHYHKVEVLWKEIVELEIPQAIGSPLLYEGPKVIVGHALRSVQKKLRNGQMKTMIEKVRYATGYEQDIDEDGNPIEGGSVEYEYDDHTHIGAYLFSEQISPDKLNAQRESERKKLAAMVNESVRESGTSKSSETGEDLEHGAGDTDLGDGVTIKES